MAQYSVLSPKTGNQARMSMFTTSIQHLTEVRAGTIGPERKKGTALTERNEIVSTHREYDFFH